ncbi:Y protein [Joa yellow blotch virus]|uniref:Y protein n=1 Tax=joa yellow blotch associated virus TaxID=3070922 RepID=A0AAE7UTF4_9RHAB|nr:Y protein [Joa yellow blotch virus]QUI75403.1 Y protein [joa yellow blotch associated virus]
MSKPHVLPDKSLSKNGLDLVLPIAIASSNQIGTIKKLIGLTNSKRDRSFVRLNKFVIKWKPTCPPELPGTFSFDFYFDGGESKYTILKGSGVVGHAVEITISTTIYISAQQLKACPYKLDLTPHTESEDACGVVSLEIWVSNNESYPRNGKRNVSVMVDPPDRHGLPSIFYHLNPNNDQYYTNIQQLIPISEEIISEYSPLMRDCLKIVNPTLEDALVLRYMVNPDEEQMVREVNIALRDNKPITTEDSTFLVNLAVRFNGSSYRKFINSITGQLDKETPTNTTRF